VAASQRGRVLAAMAEAVAEKGYGAVSVSDVVSRAGVSRKTFYAHFEDKLTCFLAAYDLGVDVLFSTVAEAGAGLDDPLVIARARVRRYLETLAAEPAFARTFLIEVNAAGPRALERRRQVHEQFARLNRDLVESFADAPRPAPDVYLAQVGATNEVVSSYVADDRTDELPQLEQLVLHIQLSLIGVPAP
jgi:AcrR family transcriptional regulator